jgi:hypothetical protein
LRLWQIAKAAGMRIYPGNHPSTSIATLAAGPSRRRLALCWKAPSPSASARWRAMS